MFAGTGGEKLVFSETIDFLQIWDTMTFSKQ
jgi:hypothetical protein